MIVVNQHIIDLCTKHSLSLLQMLKLIGIHKGIAWAKALPEEAPKYFTDKGLTIDGVNLLTEIYVAESSIFERWWRTYPLSDAHAHFPNTRVLRIDYEGCKRLFQSIVSQGVDPEALIAGLAEEVRLKKVNSTQRNELCFMPNSINYLEKDYWRASVETSEDESGASDNRSRIV